MRTIMNAFRTPDIRNRILFTIGLILIYRIGSFIPAPGVDYTVINECMTKISGSEDFIGLVNLFSGGAMLQLSVFALGVMPYINASIIVQLLKILIPHFEELHREGQSGETKLNQYTRYLAIGLAVIQSAGIVLTACSGSLFAGKCGQVIPDGSVFNLIIMTLVLIGGSGFIMWMAELITDKGIGQGMSILIFMSICSGFLPRLWDIGYGSNGSDGDWLKFGIVISVLIIVLMFIVFVELCQRRIPIQYTKRILDDSTSRESMSYIPLKINMSSVMPPIFAMSILAIPSMLVFISPDSNWAQWIQSNLSNSTSIWYIALYSFMIIGFTFFYSSIALDTHETAEQLNESSAFIPGVPAGHKTAAYLGYVMNKLNTVGSVYLLAVALIPTVLIMTLQLNERLPFGGTTILIIAGVGLDTLRQVKANTAQWHYTGFLPHAEKANHVDFTAMLEADRKHAA